MKNYKLINFIFYFGLLFDLSIYASSSIPVFYPTMLSAKARQDILKTEFGKENLDFLVFGKFKDFIDEVQAKSPDIVIAPSAFGKYYKQYKPVLQFSGKEGASFNYLLLSLSKQWNQESLSQGKAGAVEEIQREYLRDYLADILNGAPKIVKSVSKTEDLFPLLVFKSADYILLSPENYDKLKEQFSVQVYTVAKSKPVQSPMVFLKDGSPMKTVVSKIQTMSAERLGLLGFQKLDGLSRGVASEGAGNAGN